MTAATSRSSAGKAGATAANGRPSAGKAGATAATGRPSAGKAAAAAAIDPRLRARRTEVKRAEGRRRLRVLIAAAALAGLLAGGWGLSRSGVLDVDRVAVSGVGEARAELVRQAVGEIEGTPLIDIDPGDLERSVAALAWVGEVRVLRDWPGAVDIEVTPRVPVAVSPARGGGLVLVDSGGYVVGPAPPSPGLPLISVPFAGEPGAVHVAAGPGLAVVAALPADLRVWTRAVVALPRGRVGLDLAGGATAVLGEPSRLDDKMASVRSVLFGVDLECVTAIDATMADLTTLVRDPLCLPPPAAAPSAPDPAA